MLTPYLAMMRQKRSGSGQLGAPSYIKLVAPLANGGCLRGRPRVADVQRIVRLLGGGERALVDLGAVPVQIRLHGVLEAGLGFESAMARAGKNGKGPLAEELVRTLQDIAVGQPRREAYLALADRADVQDLRRFIRAVVQADAYGVSIADVLRTQAQEMRLKRRQRAEEKAMQIPVKVIFPLILCILPVLFIVLLGPAAMDIIDAFSKH